MKRIPFLRKKKWQKSPEFCCFRFVLFAEFHEKIRKTEFGGNKKIMEYGVQRKSRFLNVLLIFMYIQWEIQWKIKIHEISRSSVFHYFHISVEFRFPQSSVKTTKRKQPISGDFRAEFFKNFDGTKFGFPVFRSNIFK